MVCEWCNKTEIGQGYFKLINLKPVRELDILQNKISAGDFSWGLEAQVEKKKKSVFAQQLQNIHRHPEDQLYFPK